MEKIPVHPFLAMGVAELIIVLFVATLFFWVRSRSLKRSKPRVRKTRYIDHLDKEVALMESLEEKQMKDSDGDTEEVQPSVLALRRSILTIEKETHPVGPETQEYQQQYGEKLNRLLSEYFSVQSDEVTTEEEIEIVLNDASSGEEDETRTTINTYENEFVSLKSIIQNQHEAMRALRQQLNDNGTDVEGLNEINRILEAVENENEVLDKSLSKLEESPVNSTGDELTMDLAADNGSVLSMGEMTRIVTDQQGNINDLKTLISQLETPHGEAMDKSVGSIERTNNDLSGCLTILLGENDKLRAQLQNSEQDDTGDDQLKQALKNKQATVETLEKQISERDLTISNLEGKLKELKAPDDTAVSDLDL